MADGDIRIKKPLSRDVNQIGSSFVFLIRERNLLVLRCCVMFERCAKPRYPGLCFRMEEQWMCPS